MVPGEGVFPLIKFLHAIPAEVVLGVEVPLRTRRESGMTALSRSRLVVEATRKIRQLPAHRETPILALTANVYQDDKQAALDSGMNGFLAKPVEPEVLLATLDRLLPEVEKADAQFDLPARREEPSESADLAALLSDIDGLDVSAGLHNFAGNGASYLRMLKQFDGKYYSVSTTFRVPQTDDEKMSFLSLVHSIKGSAGTLGLIDLFETATSLDKQMRSNKLSSTDGATEALIDKLKNQQTVFHEQLSMILANDRREPSSGEPPVQLVSLLDKLTELLMVDDARVNEIFANSEADLKAAFGERINLVSQNIDNYDYPAALDALEQIAALSSGHHH